MVHEFAPCAGFGWHANGVGGYEVYFSDRRGNQVDPTPGINIQTGAFGFNDIVNRSDAANGCPNNVLDQPGEDFEGDGVPRTYGGTPLSAAAVPANQRVQSVATVPGGAWAALLTGVPASVLTVNPNCGAAATPPGPNYVYTHAQEARENPPLFFRRALKLEYGSLLQSRHRVLWRSSESAVRIDDRVRKPCLHPGGLQQRWELP